MSLELRIMPLAALIAAPFNPRKPLKPGSPAHRKLTASLAEFGLVEPLVWNELSGRVVGGHARLAILRELGYTEVPVSVVRLDPAREKALNVVLNNPEAQGRYDPGKLAAILGELEVLPELDLTGFEAKMLANLRLEPVPAPPPLEAATDRVEVVLAMDEATYRQLTPQLDALVAEFDLTTHLRRM